MNIHIETKRLILRPVTIDDAQDFFELDSNPKVHEFLGKNPVTSIEQSKAIIKNILQQYEEFNLGRLAVIKKDTNEFLGWSGLKYECVVRKEFNYYDIGYRFKEKHWGNGYATESAIASLDHGFKELKLKEISGAAEANHTVSNVILKKIGLIPSGTFKFDGELCNWYTLKNPFL
ncbi:GNAT family N-acetyltransferase [Winogradskyella sp.]|jgi:RimJ/RimL family protein N-acetyltransferase|uniref:GNAT family N-acetyltransferase n=1 Tax=Winogradskyella sp. TaxID=1883156 RepID=UPI0025D66D25|nr:GNAT family N-acetyltransferase [Winogradskyella sp.]MCT4629126.1 GNAT family N-acetyltransferase [Winogradskyella sp.]